MASDINRPDARQYVLPYYQHSLQNTLYKHNTQHTQVASDINKPDGQYVLPSSRAAVLSFVRTLPIRKVPGIGKVSEQVTLLLYVVFIVCDCVCWVQRGCCCLTCR